ncbi:hypothetical protein HELRODRAFT_191436 [Helobdella robusta]|uniref:Peptidase M12B domain-containing protein n=1 Tax=Helobdella robusta TaxID=6412 RepID=T1FSZ4_HELRO|nr:hypothetical protein HELRODRAFT_191436 [Helobdella robusta]ESO05288.1 hypothetical protein HELRODRAFT_191436 [Helobdella robusta]
MFHKRSRSFRLILTPDSSTFVKHPSLLWHNGQVDSQMDLSHIYSGYVFGNNNSYVYGSIIDGVFTGRIKLSDGSVYFVERAIFYLDKPSFHSIIYADEDVVDRPTDADILGNDATADGNNNRRMSIMTKFRCRLKRSISDTNSGKTNHNVNNHSSPHHHHHHHHHADCGMSHKGIHAWMEKVQKSAIPTSQSPSATYNQKLKGPNYFGYENKYSFESNTNNNFGHRLKRDTNVINAYKRQCSLYLQSDPSLWAYFAKLMSEDKIKDEITALFSSHVDALNSVFKNTKFMYNGMGPFVNFNFVVHRIQINSTSMCGSGGSNPTSGFCKNNLDASNFLNEQSMTNHNDYCLAFTFSYRQFTQGTIGLAWVAQIGSSGGICEKYKEFSEGSQKIYKSLNTGVVTLCNYNSRVPVKVSQITFAHEVGHNFGSLHDSGAACIPLLANPFDKSGNFLMYASATSGLQSNNNRFSECSINNITVVLDRLLRSSDPQVNCFQEKEEAFCGNGIVESDPAKNITEQCDCGFVNDCKEACCYPRLIKGPCCNADTCSFIEQARNVSCKQSTDCTEQAFCEYPLFLELFTGRQAKCPQPPYKPDGSECNENTRICFKGECSQSICNKIHWSECSSQAPPGDKSFDRGLLCFVSCLRTPCENYKGYCDVFYKCRPVNEDGPLLQLKNLLLNEKTINDIRQWVTEYWWVVLLSGVGVIVLMALFIKVCAVHTPSSNPKLKKARQLSLKRRRKRQQDQMKMGISSISASHHDVLRAGPSGEPAVRGGGRGGRSSGRTKNKTSNL